MPGVAALDQADLAVAEVRREGRGHVVLLAGADHDEDPAYVVQRERVAHRPGQHRAVAERQQHLVGAGADAGAGAGGEDHDGGGHARSLRSDRPECFHGCYTTKQALNAPRLRSADQEGALG